jgi:7-carboxy-7-deazaguanine synthase
MIAINELFRMIQGEGTYTGRMMQFVRFFGCNLSCSWCDQPSALADRAQHHSRDMEPSEIAEVV